MTNPPGVYVENPSSNDSQKPNSQVQRAISSLIGLGLEPENP